MSKELITVVTVCFNAGQTIAKTMQSVLNQTYRPLEYILVDGKSTDNTLNIIYELEPLFHEKGIAVRIVSEKDKGIFDAMNKGVKLANGRWVNFMNAGDVFYNDKTIDFVFSHEIPMEVKLVYIPVNISFCEAVYGVSSVNKIAVKKECARIRGVDHTLTWKIKILGKQVEYGIKQIIEYLIPASFLKEMKIRNRKRLEHRK